MLIVCVLVVMGSPEHDASEKLVVLRVVPTADCE
jgi:hypothetical protein